MDLSSLGSVKTLNFSMESSDVGDYGMNTPAYFCMDNFTSAKLTSGLKKRVSRSGQVKVFPNPVNNILYVDVPKDAEMMVLLESSGRIVSRQRVTGEKRITVDDFHKLPAGVYFVLIKGRNGMWSEKIIKK